MLTALARAALSHAHEYPHKPLLLIAVCTHTHCSASVLTTSHKAPWSQCLHESTLRACLHDIHRCEVPVCALAGDYVQIPLHGLPDLVCGRWVLTRRWPVLAPAASLAAYAEDELTAELAPWATAVLARCVGAGGGVLARGVAVWRGRGQGRGFWGSTGTFGAAQGRLGQDRGERGAAGGDRVGWGMS